jgi:hypothetical protein
MKQLMMKESTVRGVLLDSLVFNSAMYSLCKMILLLIRNKRYEINSKVVRHILFDTDMETRSLLQYSNNFLLFKCNNV